MIINCLVKHMETSQLLATESFSYSWLSNVIPALDGFDGPHELGSVKSDHKSRKDRILTEAQSFDFDVPIPLSHVSHVHADELFCNGLIKSVSVDHPKAESSLALRMNQTESSSPFSWRTVAASSITTCCFSKRHSKQSKGILRKCLQYFRCFFGEGCSRKKSTRVDDIDERGRPVTCWSSSPVASSQQSTPYSTRRWGDLECSIDEAVLHCKGSIGT